jgi:hypothetical protein
MPMPRPSIRFATAADGVRKAYAMSGSGPPLVKIGTWMSHLEFDLGRPVWGPLLQWLSDRFMLLRYDQRATGLSELLKDVFRFHLMEESQHAILDELRRLALRLPLRRHRRRTRDGGADQHAACLPLAVHRLRRDGAAFPDNARRSDERGADRASRARSDRWRLSSATSGSRRCTDQPR